MNIHKYKFAEKNLWIFFFFVEIYLISTFNKYIPSYTSSYGDEEEEVVVVDLNHIE